MNRNIIGNILFSLFCAVILLLSIRGLPGNPTDRELNNVSWKELGPLELSPERGKYALIYSMVENHSFSFSVPLAQFTAPDVAYVNGKFVSLFAPGVSYLVVPGYLIGRYFGLAQVGTFAEIAFFALLNMLLIRAIAIRMGAHPIAAALGALAFLFGSPAFAYAVTLYQHHISTFFILLSIYLLMRFNTVWSLVVIWMLCAFSITIDYPNFFLMLPIGLFALGRSFPVIKNKHAIQINFPIMRIIALFSIIGPLLFFFTYNTVANGSPFQLSGTLDRAITVTSNGKPVLEKDLIKARKKINTDPSLSKEAVNFFKSRLMMNGFYIYFLSPDRGILVYTPVMLFGIAGIIIAYKSKMKYLSLLVAIIGVNILLYSMWDDPYGGWAFGSRYIIPSYAILSLFIAIALSKLRKYNLFLLFFFTVFSYSVGVNTLGAITSNSNPPQIEAVALERQTHTLQPYTYVRNANLLNKGISKSFVFQTYAGQYLTAWDYYIYITLFIVFVGAFILISLKVVTKEQEATARERKPKLETLRRMSVAPVSVFTARLKRRKI